MLFYTRFFADRPANIDKPFELGRIGEQKDNDNPKNKL